MYARYCSRHTSGAPRCAVQLQRHVLPLTLSSSSSSALQVRRYRISGNPQSKREQLLSSSKPPAARWALAEQRRFIATSEGKEDDRSDTANKQKFGQKNGEVTKEEHHAKAVESPSSSFFIESMFADAKSEQAGAKNVVDNSSPTSTREGVCSDDAKRGNNVCAVIDPQILAAAEANSHNTRLSSTIEIIHDVATYVRDKTNVIRAAAAQKIRPSREEMIKTALREHRRYRRKVAQATRISRRDAQAAQQSKAYRDGLIEQMCASTAAAEKDDADSRAAAKKLKNMYAERKKARAAKKQRGEEMRANSVSTEVQCEGGNLSAPSNGGALASGDAATSQQGKSVDKTATKPRRKRKLSAKRKASLIKKLVARIESRKFATTKASPKTKDTPKKKGDLTVEEIDATLKAPAATQGNSSCLRVGEIVTYNDNKDTTKKKVCESRAMHDPTDPNSLPPTIAATVMSVIHEVVEEAIEAAASHSPMHNTSSTVTKAADTEDKPFDETVPPNTENEETKTE